MRAGAPNNDPLAATGSNGWSPQDLRVVESRHSGGFTGATLRFAFGGVEEHRGQRLTTAQVDSFAPYFAKQYGMDEQFVRSELSKVYLYVGGPSELGNAMTIGHHIFLPDEQSLQTFVADSRQGKRWMAHELAHVMQFDIEHGRNVPRYLADYVGGFVIGNAPDSGPGHSDTGRTVWGPLFTSAQVAGGREDQLGAAPNTLGDRLATSLLPGAAIGIAGGLITGGLTQAATASRGHAPLGMRTPFATGAAVFAAPVLAGAAIGMAGQQFGIGGSTLAGGALGATAVGATLGLAGALGGRAPAQLATMAGLIVGGAVLGAGTANITAATTRGWSPTIPVRTDDGRNVGTREFSYGDALHDGHWYELDAEASARRYLRGGTPPDTGRADVPSNQSSSKQRLEDRLDWGLKLPLILGIPGAAGVGIGVLGARTLREATTNTLLRRPGHNLIGDALHALGNARRGVGNSLAIGGALALAPLVAGGIAGQISGGVRGHETLGGSIGGGLAGAAAGGGLLAMSLNGRVSGGARTAWMVAGTALAGALGTVAGSAAANAVHPRERGYLPD